MLSSIIFVSKFEEQEKLDELEKPQFISSLTQHLHPNIGIIGSFPDSIELVENLCFVFIILKLASSFFYYHNHILSSLKLEAMAI